MDPKHTRILITEDEIIIALDIKKTLEKLGYEVTAVVTRFEDAIKEIELKRPDLILMDIHIAGELSGIESAEYIYKNYSIPFIYLTAMTDEETIQKAKKTEPFGYVIKPFDEISLHSTIEMALHKFRMESELKKTAMELEQEKLLNDQLVEHIIPKNLVDELRSRGVLSPRLFRNATVLYIKFELSDDSTRKISSQITFLKELDEIFANADLIIKKYELEKLISSEELYMICEGIPVESDGQARKIIMAAMDIQSYLSDRNISSQYKWKMKTGTSSGQVIAGKADNKISIYDACGDAVNSAGKILCLSEFGEISISSSTYELVKDYFEFEYRSPYSTEDRSNLDVYMVKKMKNN